MTRFVIAGGGLAGAKAAETLREEGFDGDVVLFGAELEYPYERPPLSKGYLLGHEVRYDRVPYFFSDQYDLGLECSGLPLPEV
jgi:3-phenylpropionate/trans-cinnamate dioxygenase ferredoxin reductase subunit